MWVRNAWYVAAWSHEIEGDGLLARTITNEPLVLYRTGNGSVVAMEDIVRELMAAETSTHGAAETARAG
jgi:phenylpropionate dioxygenase-like ring-hydroxylating dioxygenase large terminal subunit